MSDNGTPVAELMQKLEATPDGDSIDDLTDAIEDLSDQIAASNSGAGLTADEARGIAQEEAMALLEHLVDPDCDTERCADFREDLIALVNEHGSDDAGSEEEVNESEEASELGEEDDDSIFSDGGWETEQGRGDE